MPLKITSIQVREKNNVLKLKLHNKVIIKIHANITLPYRQMIYHI